MVGVGVVFTWLICYLYIVNDLLDFTFGSDSSMAAVDVGSSSSEDDLDYLKPPSWKRQSAVPVIDKQIPGNLP